MEKTTLLEWYREMVLVRRFEQKCAELYQMGKIGGFLHLYIGQEAVAVGSIGARRKQDHVITAYRDHAHALVVGSDPKALMAELLGKASGVSKRPSTLLSANSGRKTRTTITVAKTTELRISLLAR